ncbi:MAG: hypothetical protein HYV07_12570 [Deltaproteobacteria bacterium]|nr:hypothetical protein [Deltaproteobacteria bacterium]
MKAAAAGGLAAAGILGLIMGWGSQDGPPPVAELLGRPATEGRSESCPTGPGVGPTAKLGEGFWSRGTALRLADELVYVDEFGEPPCLVRLPADGKEAEKRAPFERRATVGALIAASGDMILAETPLDGPLVIRRLDVRTGAIRWTAELARGMYLNDPVGLAPVPGGRALAFWLARSRIMSGQLRSALIETSTGKVLAEHELGPVIAEAFMSDLLLATDAAGVTALFRSGEGVQAARLSFEGTLAGSPAKLSDSAGFRGLALAAGPDLTLAVVAQERGTGGIFAVLLGRDNSVRAWTELRSEVLALNPEVQWHDGRFVVVWGEGSGARNNDGQVWARAVEVDGRASDLVSVSSGFAGDFMGLFRGPEGLEVAWKRGKEPTLRLTRLTPCGTAQPPPAPCEPRQIPLSLETGRDRLWALAPDGDGWRVFEARIGVPGSGRTWRIGFSGQASAPVLLPDVAFAAHASLQPTPGGFALAYRDLDQNVWLLDLDRRGAATRAPMRMNEGPTFDFGGPCVGEHRGRTWVAWAPRPEVIEFRAADEPRSRRVEGVVGPLACSVTSSGEEPALLRVQQGEEPVEIGEVGKRAALVSLGKSPAVRFLRVDGEVTSMWAHLNPTPPALPLRDIIVVRSPSAISVSALGDNGRPMRAGTWLEPPTQESGEPARSRLWNRPPSTTFLATAVRAGADSAVAGLTERGLLVRRICVEELPRTKR